MLAQVYLWTLNTIELVGACLLVLSVQPVLVYLQSAIVHGLVCLLASRMIAPAFLMTQRLPLQSLFRWSTLSRAWGLPAHPVCLFAWCWNAIVWCFLHRGDVRLSALCLLESGLEEQQQRGFEGSEVGRSSWMLQSDQRSAKITLKTNLKIWGLRIEQSPVSVLQSLETVQPLPCPLAGSVSWRWGSSRRWTSSSWP